MKHVLVLLGISAIYLAIALAAVLRFGANLDWTSDGEVELFFRTVSYSLLAFPAYALVLWLVNSKFKEPKSNWSLIGIAATVFLVLFATVRILGFD